DQLFLRAGSPHVDDRSRLVGGRRYLSAAPYLLPVDEQELARLDFQQHLVRAFLPRAILPPVTRLNTILDVGCGTGRWALDVAQQFPQTRVIGLDILSPALSTVPFSPVAGAPWASPHPPNYASVQADALSGLPFDDATFDYVRVANMSCAAPLT